jgi:hypothetical protein
MKTKTLRQFSFRFVCGILVITASLISVTGAGPAQAPAPVSQLVQFFDELQQFIARIPDNTLDQGQRNSLFKKVENARAAQLRGQPCTAANILQAFLNEANVLRRGVSLIVANDLYYRCNPPRNSCAFLTRNQ